MFRKLIKKSKLELLEQKLSLSLKVFTTVRDTVSSVTDEYKSEKIRIEEEMRVLSETNRSIDDKIRYGEKFVSQIEKIIG